MFDRVQDTIVAVSSPPGASPRGIIRLSGPDAVALAAGVFEADPGEALAESPGYRRLMGRARIDADATVPAEAYVFRGPASYTRQDLVELHTAGSPPVLALLLDALTQAGARHAEPGEFTARAYFAGALDLTRVEGVAAVIHARNDSQLRASQALLQGELSRRSLRLRERVTDLLALLEAGIDFVEEEIEFITAEQVRATLLETADELAGLLREAPSVERLELLPRVLLVGRPNAGKSTLFNRLTGMDRAMQSAVAGTTRDVLSAPLRVPGGEVTLLDSAGLELDPAAETADGADPALLAAIATRRAAATADLVLLVVDAGLSPESTARGLRTALPERPAVVVLSKMDALAETHSRKNLAGEFPGAVAVSALTGEGVEALRERIGHVIFGEAEAHGAELLALSGRQRSALREAHEALTRAAQIVENRPEISEFYELLALETRGAANALSLLVGEVATDELLGRIFARFCIGK